MNKVSVGLGMLLMASLPAMASTQQCQGSEGGLQPGAATMLAGVASELIAVNQQVGTHRGVLAPAFDDQQSLDNVLTRLRIEGCRAAALAATPVMHAAAANYVPRTEHDNTPYRFNMTQNGKRMTADDFDAWLQANGYSAGRRADPTEVPAEQPAEPTFDQ